MSSSHRFQISTRHVAEIELPREFEQLYDLAYNLWWTWTPEARDLFAMIDSAKWARYRNPVQLLINVEPRHWYPLMENETFLSHYHQVTQRFQDYLLAADGVGGGTWFHQQHGTMGQRPIAYFSMEYGLHQSLAIYSGGLGVLSGDHCKAASDLGLPFVAVGLLYRHGYFQQTLNAEGLQQHAYPDYDFTRLPLRPVITATGRDLHVAVPFPGRDVLAKLWLAQVGRIPLLLLDTDIPENDPADRPITNQLYVAGREMRLVQEIILGMGGAKALRALDIEPKAWHLNEGHSAFLQLERLHYLVEKKKLPPATALQRLAANSVFTTHTPVPAGNEQFAPELIEKYFQGWCEKSQISMDELQGLGRAHEGDTSFNLTALAIRTSSWVNGVSKLNAEVTSKMWSHLFTGREGFDRDQPIRAVTNGVHARTWLGPEMQALLRRRLDADWENMLLSPEGWGRIHEISDEEFWKAHRSQKERLARFTRSRLREQYARHGSSPDELRTVRGIFSPHALTIGFARRFATYKRAKLVFSDLQRLEKLLSNEDRPVQMIFAGKAHPADRPGQELIQHIYELGRSSTLAGKVIFLENYDIRMGRMLVQGVDVWLNTPRRPLEASGTSGQKVAMNGGLNFSISDGWWPEGFNGENGWVIGTEQHYDNEGQQDAEDAASLYRLLEDVIVPLYFERDGDLPRGWIRKMKEATSTLTHQFSASRMVKDYVEHGYLPALERGVEIFGEG
jgi:starch phosphorylase